ncbi:MAG: PorP/SprF family type IX secretion system membrane protein [Chitinophagales bacterium]|nr:PorP/SprF family type IX secretion system membrane protein [Chitinophagales bacterium]
MKNLYSMRSFLTIIALLLVIAGNVKAQDVHFSQFYASPLTLNPALTGKVNGNYRIAGIYRSQWGGMLEGRKPTYGTPGISFDLPIFVGKRKVDAVGLGASFVNDFTNGGRYNVVKAMLSASYIKSLGKSSKHQLSIGVQGGIQQSKTGSFRFEDQFIGGIYNEGNTSVDAGYNNQSAIVPDFQAGLFYNGAVSQRVTIYGGFSLFHLFTPSYNITQSASGNLPRRYVGHAGLEWDLTKNRKWTLYPGVIYMNQATADELNFGTNIGYHFKVDPEGRNTSIFLGAWYRYQDAVIPMVGFEFKGFRAGFSYDATTSDLTNGNSQGAYELSLIYVGRFSSITDKKTFLFCPRF